jgi:hypothetical protein
MLYRSLKRVSFLLLFAALLAGTTPALATGDSASTTFPLWEWFLSWVTDRGANPDPNGLTGDAGPGAEPNGQDRGASADPDGLSGEIAPAAGPDGQGRGASPDPSGLEGNEIGPSSEPNGGS